MGTDGRVLAVGHRAGPPLLGDPPDVKELPVQVELVDETNKGIGIMFACNDVLTDWLDILQS